MPPPGPVSAAARQGSRHCQAPLGPQPGTVSAAGTPSWRRSQAGLAPQPGPVSTAARASHAARVLSGGRAVANERQLRLCFQLRLRKCASRMTLGEAVRHDGDLCLIVRHVLGVQPQPPVGAPAAVATVTVAVYARQQRCDSVRGALRGRQQGFAALPGGVGSGAVATPDVAGEGPPVGLVEEGVDQRVDARGDVAHPHEDVEEVVKQRLVAGAPAQHRGDVGDEERTPHDEEEEKDNPQHLKMETQGGRRGALKDVCKGINPSWQQLAAYV